MSDRLQFLMMQAFSYIRRPKQEEPIQQGSTEGKENTDNLRNIWIRKSYRH